MANSKKPSSSKRSGRGKKTNASPAGDDAKKRKSKAVEPKPKETAAKQSRKRPARKAQPNSLPPTNKAAITAPQIILGSQEPPQIVGPSLPFDIDNPRFHGLDPAVLDQWYSENLKLHEYPDPNAIEVDENGYVLGYTTKPDGRGYCLRDNESHIIVPDAVMQGLFQTDLPNLLKNGGVPSRTVLKMLTGLQPTDDDGLFKMPSDLLSRLLDLNLPDPLNAKGGKGKGGKGGGGQPLASPQLVEQVVDQAFAAAKVGEVGYNDNLVVQVQNAEFLDASKATFFLNSWVKIAKRGHITMWVECDPPALSVIGKAAGYGHFCCKPNSRGQGVGFTIHPRLELLGPPESIWAIANVGGIRDLRPGFRLHLRDKTSGLEFYAEVLHLKSMRGGPAQTAPIRYKQCEETVIGNRGLTQPILVGGDFNTFLNNTSDTLPLTQAGYQLVYPHDTTSTQAMGGRLDGLFVYQLSQKVGHYQIFNWWKDARIRRTLTDHGCGRFVIYNTGGSATDAGDSGQSVEVVTQ